MSLATLTDLGRSKSKLIAENALLRVPLIMLKRQVKRPTYTNTDRILLVLLARVVLLHDSFFMHFLAMVSGLLRPSSDGSAISVISVNNGLEGASIRKPRDDSHDQLDRRGFALQTWSLAWLSRSSGRPSSGNVLVFSPSLTIVLAPPCLLAGQASFWQHSCDASVSNLLCFIHHSILIDALSQSEAGPGSTSEGSPTDPNPLHPHRSHWRSRRSWRLRNPTPSRPPYLPPRRFSASA